MGLIGILNSILCIGASTIKETQENNLDYDRRQKARGRGDKTYCGSHGQYRATSDNRKLEMRGNGRDSDRILVDRWGNVVENIDRDNREKAFNAALKCGDRFLPVLDRFQPSKYMRSTERRGYENYCYDNELKANVVVFDYRTKYKKKLSHYYIVVSAENNYCLQIFTAYPYTVVADPEEIKFVEAEIRSIMTKNSQGSYPDSYLLQRQNAGVMNLAIRE